MAADSPSKPYAGILLLLAVLGGVSSFFIPMSAQIASLKADVVKLQDHAAMDGHPASMRQAVTDMDKQVRAHESLSGHPSALAQLAETRVKFSEVETQLKGIRNEWNTEKQHVDRRLASAETWMTSHDNRVVATNAAQSSEIKSNRTLIELLMSYVGLSDASSGETSGGF